MTESIDWAEIVGNVGGNQYGDRICTLQAEGIDTTSIEAAVEQTLKNLDDKNSRSLVVFGEPQSGKTEMMIALNARLLDRGYPILVNLLTDSVDLLEQSLSRFRGSGLNPSPKQFSELPTDHTRLRGRKWVVFCKKNARDLEKLIEYLRHEDGIIVIDDEADYASPDGNVNKADYDKTKINLLISKLLGDDGRYVGVTATPARLNLNNTFQNESENWVDFAPYPDYVGQDFFFPSDGHVNYRLHTFEADEGSERTEIEKAVLHFMCGVAELHRLGLKKNFTMLVHTSGKRSEHDQDVGFVQATMDTLANPKGAGFERLRRKLFKIAKDYSELDGSDVGEFVLRRIEQNVVVKINSSPGKSGKVSDIAKPTSLFSFGVGGNIISRGVTFDNLLSMYFTRSVKGKFSQDTYIQRARMFGSRKDYKNKFQLWIPESLIENWSKCFAFHKLALEALRSGAGVPVWLADHKTTPTSAVSIDKSSVDFEGGEMSFALFEYNEERYSTLFDRAGRSDQVVLKDLRKAFGDQQLPDHVFKYLLHEIKPGNTQISFHRASGFGTASKNYTDEEKQNIRRTKGIFATNEYKRSERPHARHHLKVFHNGEGKARIFYKINGGAIKFIQNRK
ncbi:MAG: DNA helicase [Cohaesibacteraceae bacterium]|nr:DNA helicase [Cohaesibacteraceae bacterium]